MWKDVKEYEGLYQVNEKGELKSLERYVLCKGHKKIVRENELSKLVGRLEINNYSTMVKILICFCFCFLGFLQ